MENLDELALFIFDEELPDEEPNEIEDFTAGDILLGETIEDNVALTPSQQSIANLLIDDLGETEADDNAVVEEVQEIPQVQENTITDIILSLAQYSKYLKLERERVKSDVSTYDIKIPTSSMITRRNTSVSANKQDVIYKFVEAYINNTSSTDIHLFRLWINKKDAEFAQHDPNHLLRDTLSVLSQQRNILYNMNRDNPEHLKAAIDKFIQAFTEIAGNRNKIMERFRSSQDSELHGFVEEFDNIFDNSSSYYNKPIVQMQDIYLMDDESTKNEILEKYALAKDVYVNDLNEMQLTCSCGATVPYKENIQLFQKKGSPYLKVRYAVCPHCSKKIVLHRNVLFALEHTLLASKERMSSARNQTTMLFVGRDELAEAHGFLSSNATPTYILKTINPEMVTTKKDYNLTTSQEREFIESFYNVLEIQDLKHIGPEVQYHVMQYLCNLNGLSMKLGTLVSFFYNAYIPDDLKGTAEVQRFKLRTHNESRLQKTFKELSQNKALSSYILSEESLEAKYLSKKIPAPKLPVIDTPEIKDHVRKIILAAIPNIVFEDYIEFSTQKIDPVMLHITGMGSYLEELILDPQIYAAICMRMFEVMMEHAIKQPKVVIRLPMDMQIPRDTANKIMKTLKDIRALKSFEEFNASTVFNILNIRMEDSMLAASNECRRLNRRVFDTYTPPIEVTLPGKYSTYLLYLSIIKNIHDLRSNYLRIKDESPNPWETNMDKTILLYALLKTFKDNTANPDEAENMLYYLKETGEQLCLD